MEIRVHTEELAWDDALESLESSIGHGSAELWTATHTKEAKPFKSSISRSNGREQQNEEIQAIQ